MSKYTLDSAVFYSDDIKKFIPFYVDVLGFEIESETDNFVSFIFPSGGRLGIKNKAEEREVPGSQTIFIGVSSIEEIYNELKAKNITFYKEITDKLYGKEFSLLDPDKNKVLFIKRNN